VKAAKKSCVEDFLYVCQDYSFCSNIAGSIRKVIYYFIPYPGREEEEQQQKSLQLQLKNLIHLSIFSM